MGIFAFYFPLIMYTDARWKCDTRSVLNSIRNSCTVSPLYSLDTVRFIELSNKVWSVSVSHRNVQTIECFKSILPHTDHITGLSAAFSGIFPICYTFKPLYWKMILLQGKTYLTSCTVKPESQYSITEIEWTSEGDLVVRNYLREVEPSVCRKNLSAAVSQAHWVH